MGVTSLTRDEVLAELVLLLADPTPPEGWFCCKEIREQAEKQGLTLTDNMLADRLRKGLKDKTMERKKFGRLYYYRRIGNG